MSFTGTMRVMVVGCIAAGLTACSSDDGRGSAGSGEEVGVDVADAAGADSGAADIGGADVFDDADAGVDVGPGDASDADVFDDADASAAFATVPDDLAVAGEVWSWGAVVDGLPFATLTLDLEGAPAGLTVERSDDRWDVTWAVPETAPTADLALVANATRDGALVATSAFDLRVRHRPFFASAPPTTAYVGQAFAWTPTVRDVDGGDVRLDLVDGPAWMALAADDTVGGTPVSPGAVSFTLRATDPDGLQATLVADVEVVAPIDDLRAEPLWGTTRGFDVTLVGCCFDGDVDVLVGGVPATAVDRVNAARVEATVGPLPPGEHEVVVRIDGTERGRAPDPVVVVPAVDVVSTDPLVVETPDVAHGSSSVLGWGPRGLEPFDVIEAAAADGRLRWTLDGAPAAGAVAVAMDGFVGVPAAIEGRGEPVIVDVVPAVHAPGDTVRVTLGGALGPQARFVWADGSEATAEVVDGVASVRVPVAASGRLDLRAGEGVAPRVVASAASDDVHATAPDVAMTHRRVGAAAGFRRLLVRGVGGAHPAVEAQVVGVDASVVEAGDGWMIVALDDVPAGSGEVAVSIGGRVASAGPVSRVRAVERIGDGVATPPIGSPVDPALAGLGAGPVVVVDGVTVAVTAGGGIAADGDAGDAFGVTLVDDLWTSLGSPGGAAVVDLAVAGDALLVLDAAGQLVRWPVSGDAEVLTGPSATRFGVGEVDLGRVRVSGATSLVVHDDTVFVAIPGQGALVAVGLADTSVFGDPLGAGRARVARTFAPADAAWVAAAGPCVAVGTPGRIHAWEGTAEGVTLDTAPEAAPPLEVGELDGTRLDAIGVIDDAAFSDQTLWLVSGQAVLAAAIGDRCPSPGAALSVVEIAPTVATVADSGDATVVSLPGYAATLGLFDAGGPLPAGDLLAEDVTVARVRAGAVTRAVYAAGRLVVADPHHVAGDVAHAVPHATVVDAVAGDAGVEPAWVVTRGLPRVGVGSAEVLVLGTGPLDADAAVTPVNGALAVHARGDAQAHVVGADGGAFSFAWSDVDADDHPAGSARFLGGRGVDADGPVAPTEASWGRLRSMAGAAWPWSDAVWIVDGDGGLWTATATEARRVAGGERLPNGCIDGAPADLFGVAVWPDGGTAWLVDARGAHYVATVDDGRFAHACPSGLGGVGGAPGGFAWGAQGRWTSSGAGLTVVDRAAGFATAFVVSR